MHVFEGFLSPEIEKKAKVNYRLGFLRDSVLAHEIDESLLSTINSMIYYNNFEIMLYILSEKSKLFAIIHTFSLSLVEEKVNFFCEFFNILKILQGSTEFKAFLNEIIASSSFVSQSFRAFSRVDQGNLVHIRTKILENMLFLAQQNHEKFFYCLIHDCRDDLKEFFEVFNQNFIKLEDEGYLIQVLFNILYIIYV